MHPDLYKKFQGYYKQHLDKIYNYLFYRSGYNKELAEDLVSTVFLKALENFSSFDESTASFQTWIYSIAHNQLIDFYRSKKETVPLDKLEQTAVEEKDLVAKLDAKEEAGKVLRAIQKLPKNYCELLTLRYVQGLSNNEIAEITGKSAVSVRVTIHRALATLKNNLAD